MRNKNQERELCIACSEEPCNPSCTPECDNPVHETLATCESDLGPVCNDCAMHDNGVAYQAGYAYACGYHD